jgi:type IV secretory pathway VirB4 component
MLATNAQPDPVAVFFNRLVQAIRSQDASSLHALLQFHLQSPIHPDLQRFISILRTVISSPTSPLNCRNRRHFLLTTRTKQARKQPTSKTSRALLSILNGVSSAEIISNIYGHFKNRMDQSNSIISQSSSRIPPLALYMRLTGKTVYGCPGPEFRDLACSIDETIYSAGDGNGS